MSKISSSTAVAENAISKLQGSTFSHQGQQVETSGSTLRSMNSAKTLNNDMLKDLNELIESIQGQAKKVTGLAKLIESRDQLDGQSWGF
ncbi:hypothetical protein LL14B4_01240 [Lactococcus lactis subsp. lactis]|uniref:TIGR04197 family type VII secretion effector n=1 Tax=Lactococcus lactis subsp. lactis TaxID=1360 RepID=A0A2Z3KGA9_LACLL|nr:hypothetical protein [Lactococcus lactis]AWN64885.1 hypothetical protein LL14B4_01240 [Lactococcus lactis subsp. lactis]